MSRGARILMVPSATFYLYNSCVCVSVCLFVCLCVCVPVSFDSYFQHNPRFYNLVSLRGKQTLQFLILLPTWQVRRSHINDFQSPWMSHRNMMTPTGSSTFLTTLRKTFLPSESRMNWKAVTGLGENIQRPLETTKSAMAYRPSGKKFKNRIQRSPETQAHFCSWGWIKRPLLGFLALPWSCFFTTDQGQSRATGTQEHIHFHWCKITLPRTPGKKVKIKKRLGRAEVSFWRTGRKLYCCVMTRICLRGPGLRNIIRCGRNMSELKDKWIAFALCTQYLVQFSKRPDSLPTGRNRCLEEGGPSPGKAVA